MMRMSNRIDIKAALPDGYRSLAGITRAGALPAPLNELVKVRASLLNGCDYCIALHRGIALKEGESVERLDALEAWRDSAQFTDRERAALALTDWLTTLPPGDDDPWPEVATHFPSPDSERLVLTIAAINTWNRVMIATGLTAADVPE